ncbi:TetR/AcrR family transcriptional regulator [Streptomyces coelicoflavus]
MMQRRRGQQLEAALLDAAWAELCERGWAGFALDSVARRAGTSTPVIYRRWSGKAGLVEAAVVHAAEDRPVELPDTGSLRDDLITVMRESNGARVALIASSAALLGGYFEETGTNLAELRDRILDDRHSMAETLLARAVERGEVDAGVLTPRLTSLAFDLFRHEVLTTLRPVGEDTILEIVDDIVLPLLTRRGG